jgi:hypothetical protein
VSKRGCPKRWAGSEENCVYLTTFYQDTHRYRNPKIISNHQFRADHFAYDLQAGEFICPNQQRPTYP